MEKHILEKDLELPKYVFILNVLYITYSLLSRSSYVSSVSTLGMPTSCSMFLEECQEQVNHD